MPTLKLKIPASCDVVIPAQAANLLLDAGDGNAALLYIYILSHSGEMDFSAACKRLKMSEDELYRALGVLESRSLVGKTEVVRVNERSDDVPEYSQTDVAEHIGSDKDFK